MKSGISRFPKKIYTNIQRINLPHWRGSEEKQIVLSIQKRAQQIEGGFVFAKNILKKFLPYLPRYAVHLVIILITVLVVFNNLSGKRDIVKGEDKEGSCLLFAGVFRQENNRFIEGGVDLENGLDGIGGFSAQMVGTVLAANDVAIEQETMEEEFTPLPTVLGTALIPLAVVEQEIVAGPVEEERQEVVEHTVNAGESVSMIAAHFGVSTATILTANNLSESSYIRPGDTLKIPPVSGVLHTVKSGDTLSEIAKKYDGDVNEIMAYNQLQDEGSIIIGQVVMIPGGKIPPPPSSKTAPRTYVASQVEQPSSQGGVSFSGWRWPTTSHKINQYYSYRHHGVDIDGNVGSPIYSASEGTIIFAGWRSGYGKSIIVSHPNGTQTLYAHLSGYQRTSGYVGSGELIGYIGTTGWSSGPHLHFEIRTGRGATNPLNYLR